MSPVSVPLHRNSQKRYYVEGATYFLTTNTQHRLRYFDEFIIAELFLRELWFSYYLKEFKLYGYNVLPEHFHLLIQPSGNANYSEIMGSIKRNTARDINNLTLGKSFIRNAIEGDDTNRRLQSNVEKMRTNHPHVEFNIVLQHFNALEDLRKRFEKNQPTMKRPFHWQKSFRDHLIRNDSDFENHLEYIYSNAVKHKLVDDPEKWRFMWVLGMQLPSFAVGSGIQEP